jgi:hypothetical protein
MVAMVASVVQAAEAAEVVVTPGTVTTPMTRAMPLKMVGTQGTIGNLHRSLARTTSIT